MDTENSVWLWIKKVSLEVIIGFMIKSPVYYILSGTLKENMFATCYVKISGKRSMFHIISQ